MKIKKVKLTISILLSLVLFSIFAYAVISVTSCTSDKPESLDPAIIINQIFPNIYVLIAQLIAGVILFLVLLLLI